MFGNPWVSFLLNNDLARVPWWGGAATPGIAGPITGAETPPMEPRRRHFLDRFAPRTHGGMELPPDVSRESVRRVALLLGMNLLEAAPRGDLSGAMARGGAAAMADRDTFFERAAERRRQQEDDRRRQEAHDESLATSQQGRTHADEDQGFQREAEGFRRQQEDRLRTVWGREDEDREGRLAAARALVEEVKEVAGEDSYEARRAEALLHAGPESLDDLEKLHDAAVGRARFDEDFNRETAAGIRRGRAEIEAGVASDPRVSDAYTRRLADVAGTGGNRGAPTPTGFNDDVRQEANRIYGVLVDEAEAQRKKILELGESETEPPPVDFRGLSEQAQREAERVVRQRYGEQGAPVGGGAASVTDTEVAAVRAALVSRNREQVIAGLKARGVPDDKIAELLRRAGQ